MTLSLSEANGSISDYQNTITNYDHPPHTPGRFRLWRINVALPALPVFVPHLLEADLACAGMHLTLPTATHIIRPNPKTAFLLHFFSSSLLSCCC